MLSTLCCLITLASGHQSAKKVAIVVGVQSYAGGRALQGCVNDADSINTYLSKQGFKTTFIKDVNKLEIQGTFDAMQKDLDTNGSASSFVFYFAGHGTSIPSAIVPKDGITGDDKLDTQKLIKFEELKDWIHRIPAVSKTVILDSCFSGGIAKGGPEGRGRYIPPTGAAKGAVSSEDLSDSVYSKVDDGVCYIVSADKFQVAREVTGDDDEKRGLFTFSLVAALKSQKGAGASWAEIMAITRKKMRAKLQKEQPTAIQDAKVIPESYMNTPLFAKGDTPPAIPASISDLFDLTKPGYDQYVTVEPKKQVVAIGESLGANFAPSAEKTAAVFVYRKGDKCYAMRPFGSNDYLPLEGKATSQKILSFTNAGQESLKVFYFSGPKRRVYARAFASMFPFARQSDSALKMSVERPIPQDLISKASVEDIRGNLAGTVSLSFTVERKVVGMDDLAADEIATKLAATINGPKNAFQTRLSQSILRFANVRRLVRLIRRPEAKDQLNENLIYCLNRVITDPKTDSISWLPAIQQSAGQELAKGAKSKAETNAKLIRRFGLRIEP